MLSEKISCTQIAIKISQDAIALQMIFNILELLDLVCRGVKVDEFNILKKSSVEVIQHRLE